MARSWFFPQKTATLWAVVATVAPMIFCLIGWSAPGDQDPSPQAPGDQQPLPAQTGEQAQPQQEQESLNPFAGDEQGIKEGGKLFRQLCSGCHGARGRGGKGPDLTDTRWLHGSGDAEVFRVIQRGVRGSTMKQLGESISEEQIWKIIAFVRTRARAAGDPEWKPYMPGDPVAGKKLFFDEKGKATCVKCHSVDGKGGKVGPPLSRIAAQRSPQYLMESMVLPSADINPDYEAVVVVTKRGRVITGVRVNEDNFTIQMRDQETGRLYSFFKRNLEEVHKQEKSLMPENLAEQLTVKDLHDLFAYVMTLDGQSGKSATQEPPVLERRSTGGLKPPAQPPLTPSPR